MEFNDFLHTAEEAARSAGMRLRELFLQPRIVQSKGFRDLVTDADIAAQTIVTDLIRERYPTHGFLTEEDDESLPASGDYIWVIDPLDGTSNYSFQLPLFSVSVGVVDQSNQSVVGAVYDPMRDEMFTATVGKGAFRDGEQMFGSPRKSLDESVVAFDWSRSAVTRRQLLDSVNRVTPLTHTARSVGSAALGLAWVAAGRFDAYFNFGLYAWDGAAGRLLIKEAGGKMSNLAGFPWQLADDGCLASSAALHEPLQKLVHR